MEQVHHYLNEYGFAMGVALVAGVLAYVMWPSRKVPGEGKMKKAEYILSRREAKQKENNVIADEVETFLLKLFSEGRITEERYRHWHMRFGTQLGLKDLLPVKLTPAQIKKAANARLNSDIYKPVPFFKEVRKPRHKNIIDRILNSEAKA